MSKQRRQNVMRRLTSSMLSARATRVLGRQTQQVVREALRRLRTDAGQATEFVDQGLDGSGVDRHGRRLTEQSAEAGQPAERGRVQLVGLLDHVVQRGENEVFDHRRVAVGQHRRVDRDGAELESAGGDDAHRATAGDAFELLVDDRGLRLHHLRLHLLRLPEQVAQIRPTTSPG